MAPLSRTAIVSLAALTIHYAVLSIVLHVSTARSSSRYHSSSAVVLTELFKIIVSAALIFATRELRPQMLELKRERHARLDEEDLAASEPSWVTSERRGSASPSPSDSTGEEKRKDSWEDTHLVSRDSPTKTNGRPTPEGHHRRRSSMSSRRTDDEHELAPFNGSPRSTSSVNRDTIHRKASSLRVNVDAANFPSLALIPATPALPPSPFIPPDPTSLHPLRVSFSNSLENHSLLDIFDADAWLVLRQSVFGPGWVNLALPALLFVFQANAQYVASANLSVPVFQLAYQLKIPATALCSVVILHRTLTLQQWISLFILSLGVGVVQLQSSTSDLTTSSSSSHHPVQANQALGLVAVIGACMSSGFASTYVEKMLKSSPSPAAGAPPAVPPSLWIRNIQLSLFGLLFGLPLVLYQSWKPADTIIPWFDSPSTGMVAFFQSFFSGFTGTTWMVIFLQVTGGLLGALVMQQADNIAKCFSTSLSILISFVLSVLLFDFRITTAFFVGAICILASTYTYASRSLSFRPRIRPSPVSAVVASSSN